MKVTAAEYAKQKEVSIGTARKRLNEMVEDGRARVDCGVIFGHCSTKHGARSKSVAVRGNLYHVN